MKDLEKKPNLIQLIVDGMGLTEAQARAFVGLYARGYVTDSKIAAMAQVPLEEAKEIMNTFLEKGLATKIAEPIRGVPRYMPTVPWSAFTTYLDTFQGNVATLREEFDKNIKDHIDALKQEVLLLKTGVADAVHSQIAKFNEETLKAKENTSQTITKHITTLTENIDKRKQETSGLYKQKIEAHENTIHSYEGEVDNALNLKYKVITEATQKIEDDATSGHQNSINTLEKNIDSVLDDFTGRILDQTSEENKTALTKLNEHLDKSFDEYVTKTYDVQNKYQSETFTDYDEIVQELDNHQNNKFSEYDSWYEDLSKKLLDQIETEIKGAHEKNAELKDEVKNSQELGFEWFKNRAAVMRERAAEKFNAEIEHQENTFGTFGDSIKGITGDLVIRFKNMLDEIRDNFQSKIDEQLGTLKSVTELEQLLSDSLDKKVSSIKAESLTMETKIGSSMDSTISGLTNSMEQLKKTIQEKMAQVNNTHKGDLKEIVKSAQGDMNKFIKAASTRLEEWGAEFKKSGDAFIKEAAERARMLNPDDQDLKEKINEFKSFKDELALKDLIAGEKEKLSNQEHGFETLLNDMFEKTSKESDGFVEELANFLGEISTSINESMAETNKTFINGAKTQLDSILEAFLKNAETFSVETAKAFNTQVEKIESDFYQVKGTLSGDTDALVKQVKDVLDEVQVLFLEKIKEQITRLQKETGDLEKTLSETLDERINTYRGEIDQARENFYTGVDLRVSNLEKQSHAIRDESVTKLLSSLITKHKDAIRDIQTGRNNTVGTHKTNLEGIVRDKQKEIDTNTVNLKEDVNKTVQQDIERVEKVRTEGHAAEDNMKAEISDFVKKDIERVNKMATDVQTKISGEVEKGYNTIKTEIKGIDEKHLKVLDELTTTVGTEHNEVIGKHGDDFQSDASTMEVELLELATSHQNEYELNVNSLNDQLAGKLEETDVILTDRLVTVNDDAAKQFKECEELTQERSKILRAVWNETEKILAVSGELTWILVTQDAIEEYITDMLKRTKSTISIVAPDFYNLPLDAIKSAKRSIRIKTTSRILADSKKDVATLLELGNVEIRQRADRDLFAAARDGEEVLLAPITERETQNVAIVSQEAAIVKYIHEIIGPLVIARSQRISRI